MTAILGSYPSNCRRSKEPSVARRGLTFCGVGLLGIAVQLAALATLTATGLHYMPATALAVEAAVLHNFFWHEQWTWSDRAALDRSGRWMRLLRFQISNGALSLAGNLILMRIFVGAGRLNYTLANILAITLCAILNFLASDRWVFTGSPQSAPESRGTGILPVKGRWPESHRKVLRRARPPALVHGQDGHAAPRSGGRLGTGVLP